MRSGKSEMPSLTRILAREAAAAGMRRPGVAQDHRPGQKDTTRVHQAGARAHVAGKEPVDDLIRAISRRGDVQAVEEAKNLAKGLEKKQIWRRRH